MLSLNPLPQYSLSANNKCLDLTKPRVMGILNVTPDSFSDGGQFNQIDIALNHVKKMLSEGVDIIDIGGESTRPNAEAVSHNEEIRRVIPIIKQIREQISQDVWISVDTSNPEVMTQAVAAGANIINDVRALKRDGALQAVANLQVPVVLMHMRGEPQTMNQLANYDSVLDEVKKEITERIMLAQQHGIKQKNIIIDPGFGFAKNYPHHCELLTHLDEFKTMNLPLLFGVSRKRFLGELLSNTGLDILQDNTANQRDNIGMAVALLAVQQGASIIRTHDVLATKQALSLFEQLQPYT